MTTGSPISRLGYAVLGALAGGLLGGFCVVGVTLVLKSGMTFASKQQTWLIVLLQLLGLAVAVLILHGYGREDRGEAAPSPRAWRTFPRGATRSDISGDVLSTAGQEERFPWRLAPLRALAILATVGSGGALGTEAPAAYLGVAVGACLGDRGVRWRRLLRPAALAGGAAGVAALMGIPLVGTLYMLEFGWGRHAVLTVERATAAVIGGLIGWGIDVVFHLQLINLVVPHVPPTSLRQAAFTALFIGAISGAVTATAAWAIYRAKKWQARPGVRLALGGALTLTATLALAAIAVPSAAGGPGGGAIAWAESTAALPTTLLAVALLRATATTAAIAAGGCGGVFVPFLAVGDLAGRVFAPGLDLGTDLAGAAGAAGGIAGGYRLPLTATAVVLGVGGPPKAVLTCLATIVVAFLAGAVTERLLERLPPPAERAHRPIEGPSTVDVAPR